MLSSKLIMSSYLAEMCLPVHQSVTLEKVEPDTCCHVPNKVFVCVRPALKIAAGRCIAVGVPVEHRLCWQELAGHAQQALHIDVQTPPGHAGRTARVAMALLRVRSKLNEGPQRPIVDHSMQLRF